VDVTGLTPDELRDVLSGFDSDTARSLARQLDRDADDLKRRARALTAYADALDRGALAELPTHKSRTTRPNDRGHSASPNKPPLIIAVLEERPMPGWHANAMRHTLVERGLVAPETTEGSINAAMRRMLRSNQIARLPDGLYTTREAAESAEDRPLAD
jgi:hypothetical protein